MPDIVKKLFFGLVAFIIFTLIAVILKYTTGQLPQEDAFLGIFTETDLLLGLVVAVVVTFSHERRKNLKK
jgi:hypothetical protein